MSDSRFEAARRQRRPARGQTLWAGALWFWAHCAAAQAPAVTPETLQLRNSAALEEAVSPLTRSLLPTFVSGDTLTGRPDLETVVQGNARLRRGDLSIRADRLEYNQATDRAKATGQVRINRAGNVYEGPALELSLEAFEGFFSHPSYRFLQNDAHGQADRVDFLDDQRSVIHNATYTTCQNVDGESGEPAWLLRAQQISLDHAENMGSARSALLSFQGVPLLPIPYVSFPLSTERKSGLLPPTLGLDNVNGFELALPYYWNIAPNRDATFTPTLMTDRGLKIDSEFRYLEPAYAGTVQLDWMPNDGLRNTPRWAFRSSHQGRIFNDWTPGGLALNLSLNRVSDDDYWRDFAASAGATSQQLSAAGVSVSAAEGLTQRLLANDVQLSWSRDAVSYSLRTLKWQTLQDPGALIVPPYDRMPQIAARYAQRAGNGLDLSLEADYTRFESDPALTGQPNGQRLFSRVQISRSWQLPAGYITPKLQWHATHYALDAHGGASARQFSRALPTFSLDAGVVFERDAHFFGRDLLQTLEPRAFFVHTPYRDQSGLPNYDSGANDFNLATLYTENAFVGNDRISDSQLLTLGVTSRLLDPASGAEAVRLGVAQRLRFNDQRVTLNPSDPVVSDRWSDILLGASVNWDPRWRFDGTVQFNPDMERSVRSVLGASYRPGRYRNLSAAYRFQRQASEQVDLGWQWPVAGSGDAPAASAAQGRWYSVGRLNYSMDEGQLVNTVLGLEYDAGCWLGRVVVERLKTGAGSATQRIMFQLEFSGFSRLGVNPARTLQTNIPGYESLRQNGARPSRFSHYD